MGRSACGRQLQHSAGKGSSAGMATMSVQTATDNESPLCALPACGRGAFVSASRDGAVCLWDADTDCRCAVLVGHTDAVLALASVMFPASGDASAGGGMHVLASGSADCTVRLWPAQPLAVAVSTAATSARAGAIASVKLTGHTAAVRALTSLRCGRLASGSSDGDVRIWAAVSAPTKGAAASFFSPSFSTGLAQWACVTLLRGTAAPGVGRVLALAELPDGLLVSAGTGDALCVWDLTAKTPAVRRTIQAEEYDSLEALRVDAGGDDADEYDTTRALAVLPDGRLISSNFDGALLVWR